MAPATRLHHPADVNTDMRFINGVNEKETGGKAAGQAKDALSLMVEAARHERVDHDRRARGEPSCAGRSRPGHGAPISRTVSTTEIIAFFL